MPLSRIACAGNALRPEARQLKSFPTHSHHSSVTAMTAAPGASNPALQQFVLQLGDEFVLAQVCIRRTGLSYDLRHIEDRTRAPESLRLVPLSELRVIGQFTASGAFRPLKSAPTLQTGWRAVAH